jgi:DNA repair photolyase
MKTFGSERAGTGTAEWAETTFNICRGCRHNCRYCYAAANAHRFGWRDRSEWEREELTANANIKNYPAKQGVIMFPSSHDITPGNVDAYVRVALTMLYKGNRLLIVSKPHLECVNKMLDAFTVYRDQILFRFTIGSVDQALTSFWEPGAPLPFERRDCLRAAHGAGYRTSVSVEPMLSGRHETLSVVAMVKPWVTDTIWIGKMNKASLRVVGHRKEVANIKWLQRDEEIIELYQTLKNDPAIRWKDSIREVIERTAQ